MHDILRGEGWDLKERELTKLRKEQNLLLREPNRNGNGSEKRKRRRLGLEVEPPQDDVDGSAGKRARTADTEPSLPPEIAAKREARQARLLAESEERLKNGTRRRRTKVWSGIAPDPEAPPRYPSELTLEECKRALGLDRKMYMEIRDIFEGICRSNNVVKKTLCGADTWTGVKDELISNVPHLQRIFWGSNAVTASQTQQPMAFEIICMDVTKKIRTVGSRVTISEAKNILALTPQEGRNIRSAFDSILKQDYFVSKLDVPREHWEGLKARWIEESPLLRQKFAGEASDPDYDTKMKCLESIAADVQKRHRDQQTKTDPGHLTKSLNPENQPYATPYRNQHTSKSAKEIHSPARRAHNPSPIIDRSNAPFPSGKSMDPPAPNSIPRGPSDHDTGTSGVQNISFPPGGMTNIASQALANASQPSLFDYGNTQDMQIDPTLLQAAAMPQQTFHYEAFPPQTTTDTSLPVFFRIAPSSSPKYLDTHPKVWLNTLNTPSTVDMLKQLALTQTGDGEASVKRIEGVAPSVGSEAGTKWSIDEDDELEAYLAMVGRGKATFVVEII